MHMAAQWRGYESNLQSTRYVFDTAVGRSGSDLVVVSAHVDAVRCVV